MTILVTGVAGFIGSNFLEYLISRSKDEMIIGLDSLTYAGNLNNISELLENENFKMIVGDISEHGTVSEVFSKFKPTTVINFAAESHVDRSISDPQIFIRTNVLGTQVLLDRARKEWSDGSRTGWEEGSRFVQVSTDEVYGALGPEGLFSESSPIDPHSPYSASKAGADLIVQSYHDTYNMPVNITRCSNNYGPYQFPEKLIPLMIKNALEHKPLPIYGDGKQVRDWLYVEDHCKAIKMVMGNASPGEIYNIGGHNEKENIQIVGRILELLRSRTGDEMINSDLIEHVEDRLGHDRRYAIDPTKITNDLGWKPDTMFDNGIEMTIDWYLSNTKWMEDVISGRFRDLDPYTDKLLKL